MLTSTLLCFTLAQGWTPIVQIGQVDRDTAELALGPGGYDRYSADPVFIEGYSEAKRDWPYVIPGPGDAWAAAREHTFEIYFGLEAPPPGSEVRLRVSFAETHSSNAPRLRLTVNGTKVTEWDAPRGNGDAAVQGRPKEGKPSEWVAAIPAARLKPGENRIEIASISGSWAVFDAVAVEGRGVREAPLTPNVELRVSRPSPMQLNTPQGPARELGLRLINVGPPAKGTLDVDGKTESVEIPTGATDLTRPVPSPKTLRQAKVLARTTDGRSAEAAVDLRPVKLWRIFLFPESHVDIGYTHPQEMVAEIQAKNVRDALDLADATRDRPVGERFRWNAETAWSVEQFLKNASPADRARLEKAVRTGDLGVSAAYLNMLYGLCRPEEMLRAFTVPQTPGASGETAILSDVPGFPWGLASAMSEAGVKHLVCWPNSGDIMRGDLEDRPFWWVAPNGRDRVFVWPTVAYSLGTDLKGILHMGNTWFPHKPYAIKTDDPTRNFLADWLPKTLDRLGENYPYDILGVPWSMGDNGALDLDVPEAVRLWNQRYASPKIEIMTIDEACRRFLAAYGGKLPTLTGDFGPQWEDGAASSARETTLNRQAAERLAQAEIAWSLYRRKEFPRPAFAEAWRNALLYSEHTWGAHDSITNPDGENQRRQWATKKGFAESADSWSRRLLTRAVGTGGSNFDILNTSAHPRSALVSLETTGAVTDARQHPLPTQVLHDNRTVFLAQNVPPLGTKRYHLRPDLRVVQPPKPKPATVIENGIYRVEVDPATGAIASLRHLKTNRELVNRKGAPAFGQYGYVLGTDPSKITHLRDVRVEKVDDGPLVYTLRITGRGDGANGEIVKTVSLTRGVDAVEVAIRLDKKSVREKEIAFLSFPFSFDRPTVRVEGPWAPFNVGTQLFKSANNQFFTINRWVHLEEGQAGATVVPLDTPIVVHGRPSVARLDIPQKYDPNSPNLHFQLAQNHWYVNYRPDQSGPISARFVLRAENGYDPGASSRFAENYVRPLVQVEMGAPSLPFAVEGNVELSALRPSADGKGWVLRVYGASGKPASLTIRPKAGQKLDVFESDARERRGRAIKGSIPVHGFDVKTVLVVPRS